MIATRGREPGPTLRRRAHSGWLALVLPLLIGAGPARAQPADLAVPLAEAAPALDGRAEEPLWQGALALPLEPLLGPGQTPELASEPIAARVRAVMAQGCLWLAVEVAEDPGAALGLHVFLAAGQESGAGADLGSSSEAVSLTWRPLEVRSERWVVRAPHGAGRAAVRVLGAVDASRVGAWSGEVGLALADLGMAPSAPLRVAFTLLSRTPHRMASAPADVFGRAPSQWLSLRPAQGDWPAQSALDGERCAAEVRADRAARAEWIEYLKAMRVPPEPGLSPTQAREFLEGTLLKPLAALEAARPELQAPLACLRGDLFWRVGLVAEAQAHFEQALARAPGWREALFGRYLQVEAQRRATRAPGAPTDYDAALADLDAAAADVAPAEREPWRQEGLRLARGMLLLKRGEFARSAALLGPLATRHAQAPWIVLSSQHAEWGATAWPDEQIRWLRDAEEQLPRALLRTERGDIELELFQHEVPNSVNHFVWLAEQDYFDGLAVDRSVPFLLVQSGDPATRQGADPGVHGPGYAIRTEVVSERLPFRGSVLLARDSSGQEGSRFQLLLGSALHLAGQYTILGRIVAGMDVADSLRAGDRLLGVEIQRKTEGWIYRPQTVTGEPAPPVR